MTDAEMNNLQLHLLVNGQIVASVKPLPDQIPELEQQLKKYHADLRFDLDVQMAAAGIHPAGWGQSDGRIS